MSSYTNNGNEVSIKFAKFWVNYVCDLFRTKFNLLFLDSNASIEHMSAVAEWTKSLISECWFCHIAGDDAKSESITRFFEITNFPIRFLIFDLKHEYEIAPINCGVLNVEEVRIFTKTSKNPVNWFTVEQMMRTNCSKMILGACTFDENDLNQFIKGWINGNNSKMELFITVVKTIDFALVFDGIEVDVRDPMLVRPFYSSMLTHPLEFLIVGGLDIRRNDGTVASIQPGAEFAGPRVMNYFTMVVWPQGKPDELVAKKTEDVHKNGAEWYKKAVQVVNDPARVDKPIVDSDAYGKN
ncbi:hypothetical protein GCK72_008799 [Caenorhabditis remanei]|uniref:Sdz-33 F-box domain-containing protein n=1 Tax=Caenorhabditis remanei TaxID=31234 RepID=A0A6A5GYH4_CAERE|nr:hypothetical protein GCK72_008799 [Caenorhabditis remanei]KAF1760550.1 hypothetical protein GCK72_008799 [Caenorhabditis remanei]